MGDGKWGWDTAGDIVFSRHSSVHLPPIDTGICDKAVGDALFLGFLSKSRKIGSVLQWIAGNMTQ
eukprot:15361080-Ditylum_brightwellii.AAC.1